MMKNDPCDAMPVHIGRLWAGLRICGHVRGVLTVCPDCMAEFNGVERILLRTTFRHPDEVVDCGRHVPPHRAAA